MSDLQLEKYIVNSASELGFDGCGFAKADFLETESARVEEWLSTNNNGTMQYIERNRSKRYDPRLLVEGTKAVVAVVQNYFPEQKLNEDDNYQIAKYAYGADYHTVVKNKLHLLLQAIERKVGSMPTARVFCDSAPVLDRAWAVRCGLGFIGKNTSLIVPKKGSFFFIGIMMLPIELTPSPLLTGTCGTCTRCIDACPTHALSPFNLDARKCLSYLTIEHKGQINSDLHGHIYGCDACQDACPYNHFAKPTIEKLFSPKPQLRGLHKSDWQQLDAPKFEQIFGQTAFERAGFENLKRNIEQNQLFEHHQI